MKRTRRTSGEYHLVDIDRVTETRKRLETAEAELVKRAAEERDSSPDPTAGTAAWQLAATRAQLIEELQKDLRFAEAENAEFQYRLNKRKPVTAATVISLIVGILAILGVAFAVFQFYLRAEAKTLIDVEHDRVEVMIQQRISDAGHASKTVVEVQGERLANIDKQLRAIDTRLDRIEQLLVRRR